MTDFYTVSDKQTVIDIPDFDLVYRIDPNGPDFTADAKTLDHSPALQMPGTSVHRIVFDFVSGNFFSGNPGAHMAIVARCDTVALAPPTNAPRGAGMVIGNVSGYPGGRGNPVYPSAQIEAFWAGMHPNPESRNDLIPSSSWSGTFQDNVKYRIVLDSEYKNGTGSRTRYEIHTVAGDGTTTELFKTAFISDGNIWYDPNKNGVAIAYVLGNINSVGWTLKFSNVKSIVADTFVGANEGFTDWSGFELANFNVPGQVINAFDDFTFAKEEGIVNRTKVLNASNTGGFNFLAKPGSTQSNQMFRNSNLRLMFTVTTKEFLQKALGSIDVVMRCSTEFNNSPWLEKGGKVFMSGNRATGSGLPTDKVTINVALEKTGTQDLLFPESVYETIATDTFTVIIDTCLDRQGLPPVDGSNQYANLRVRYKIFSWASGSPILLKDSGFYKTDYFVSGTIEKVNDNLLGRSGIQIYYNKDVSNHPFGNVDWELKFSRVKAAWAELHLTAFQGDTQTDLTSGETRSAWAKVEISHPEIFKINGLKEFLKKPLRDKTPEFGGYFFGKESPPEYTNNGIAIRNKDGSAKRHSFAHTGGQSITLAHWELNELSIEIDTEKYFPGYEKDKAPIVFSSVGPTYTVKNDVLGTPENNKIASPHGGFNSENYPWFPENIGEVKTYDDDGSFHPERLSSVNDIKLSYHYSQYPGYYGIALLDKQKTITHENPTPPKDKTVEIYVTLGNVSIKYKDETKQIAQDVWVKITLPIDTDYPAPDDSGSGGTGAPVVPTFPNPWAGKNPPTTPEATIQFASQFVSQTTTVPVNKHQHIALVAAASILGPVAYKSSRLFALLNSGDVLAAADAIADLSTYVDLKLDKDATKALNEAKRIHALLAPYKNVFLQGGYLDEFGEFKHTPQSLDALMSQPGYVATPPFLPNDPVGFSAPNKQYPKPTAMGEPDTNRLSRQERARATALYKREQARHRAVIKANQGGQWDQPQSGYNSQYPYNHLTQTESGHLFEMDDTPGSERVNLQHRTGTFFEIDNNGTMVRRTVGDDYTILERDGKVHIVGNADITIGGANRVRVENTFDLEVHGATNINIYNNANVKVSGDVNMKVSGNTYAAVVGETHVTSMGNMNLTTMADMYFKSKGQMRFDAKGGFNVKSGAGVTVGATNEIYVNGKKTYLQSGGADGNAIVPEVKMEKDPIFTPRNVVLPPLAPLNRGEADGAVYESPDEGSQAQVDAWKNKRLKEGTASAQDINAAPKIEKKESAQQGKAPAPVDVQVPQGREFRADDKLSKYFTLADLTANYSRKLTDRFGNTAEQKFKNLAYLCTNTLDVVKKEWPSMKISSGLRDFVPPGGATKSQHLTGEAVDIQFPGLDRKGLVERAKQISGMIPYDQLLLEFNTPGGNGWIHISLKESPRGQAFTMNNHKKVSGDGEFVLVA